MKAGGGAKQNASLEQGIQVSTATQRASTTTRHHHTKKLSGDTYKLLYSPRPAKKEGREGGQTATQMHDLELKIAQPPRASTRHLRLSENPYIR